MDLLNASCFGFLGNLGSWPIVSYTNTLKVQDGVLEINLMSLRQQKYQIDIFHSGTCDFKK